MKTLLTLVVGLFVVAVGTFVASVRDAQARASTAADALAVRERRTETLLRSVPPVSYAEVDVLLRRREQLAELVGLRKSTLVDSTRDQRPPALPDVLAEARLKALRPGTALHERLLPLQAEQPRTAQALARALQVLEAADIEVLESLELRNDGRAVPVASVPGLVAVEFELVLLGSVNAALEALEGFTPGRGAPGLTVTAASLRRIDPALWPESSWQPPVRLWLDVAVLFGDAGGS